MGPSSTHGAIKPSLRRPATKVVVFVAPRRPSGPVPSRGRIHQAFAALAPAVEASHRRGCAGLVQEHEALAVHVALPHPKTAAMPGHIGAILLACPQALFCATSRRSEEH